MCTASALSSAGNQLDLSLCRNTEALTNLLSVIGFSQSITQVQCLYTHLPYKAAGFLNLDTHT